MSCLKDFVDRILSIQDKKKQIQVTPWLDLARAELGQKEIPGYKHNKRIIEYGKAVDMNITSDEIPWCSNFLCWVFESCGKRTPRSAAARSWLNWGRRVHKEAARPGDVVVLWRNSPSDWRGHVGLYISETKDSVKLLGGNQSDSVSIANYPKSRILGVRRVA